MKVIPTSWKISKKYTVKMWGNATIILDMDDELFKIGLIETLMFTIHKTKIGD